MVAPVGRGKFSASFLGRVLVESSNIPFCDAARVLAGEGVDPAARIVMRHEGQSYDALTSTVEVAAALSIDESGGAPRFTRWNMERFRGVSLPVSETDRAATIPQEPENADGTPT